MKIDVFIKELRQDIENNVSSFVANMKHLGIDDRSFCKWIEIFSAWMEWGEKDCEQNHIKYAKDINEN